MPLFKRRTSPLPVTTVKPNTQLRVMPYLMTLIPPALVPMLPPICDEPEDAKSTG